MAFITKQGLRNLDLYKYQSAGYTWLGNQINPFWEWSVKLLPIVKIQFIQTMAPNLVTFIGFVFTSLSYTIMLFDDFTFK
jgi:hypothetical protein